MDDVPLFFRDPGSEDRFRAKDLCHEYNLIRPSDVEERKKMIRKIFGRVGNTFQIQQPFHCDMGCNIIAGNNLFINHNCVILDTEKVTIGDNVLIGPNCGIYAASHPIDAHDRINGIGTDSPISIGSDVWIGGNVSILQGVTIGDNVVIGAGSVVTKDIPSNVIAAGNPCRILRKIPELSTNQ